jgi:LytS/YehU family sensor histidine kinase
MFILGIAQTIALDRLRTSLPLDAPAKRWMTLMVVIVPATVVQTLFDLYWIRWVSITLAPGWQHWALNITPQRLFTVGFLYLWTFCLAVTVLWAIGIRGAVEASAARAASAEASLHRAEAAALRLQLNPHFLFNSLNSISSLVLVDRKYEAEEMIERLCDFLRASLNADPMADVPLAQEIDTIDAYLGVEAVRFGGRLQVDIDVAPGTAESQVPNFILQPLVENAVKHGVATTRGPASLRVAAERDGDALVLSVVNSSEEVAEEQAADPRFGRRRGIGLLNIRQRLATCYGELGRLETCSTTDGYRAVIRLPFIETVRPSFAEVKAGC